MKTMADMVVSVRLPKETVGYLQEWARDRNETVSQIVRYIITNDVEKERARRQEWFRDFGPTHIKAGLA